jgi:hypothetical protein
MNSLELFSEAFTWIGSRMSSLIPEGTYVYTSGGGGVRVGGTSEFYRNHMRLPVNDLDICLSEALSTLVAEKPRYTLSGYNLKPLMCGYWLIKNGPGGCYYWGTQGRGYGFAISSDIKVVKI